MRTAFLHISTQPYIYIFASPQLYTHCRETLHNVGFCVEFADQILHTYPYDYQTLNPNYVGFEGNSCTLEKRIGVKGENARLARGAYFTFFPAFLFEDILAQFLL